jgi:asparagine synthase (glutamine-hydrolysing)
MTVVADTIEDVRTVAATKDLLPLIRKAVYDRIEPGKTGIVVSGGLDSSTVASIANHLPMFTGYYDSDGCDEREYAFQVANHLWTPIRIVPQDFIDNFLPMLPFLKPPFQGMGTFGQYMVGKAIATTGIKVVLSGEGADELFGGYARQMIVAGKKPPEGYENYQLPADYPKTLKGALNYDYERLPQLLAVDDQCMAAHGLEARAPFTDQTIVDFALALPVNRRVGKKYLRDAVRGLVPDVIIDRKDKIGFACPLVEWANGPCKEFVGDLLGYIPDPDKPWDRAWWIELCETFWHDPHAYH